MVEITPALVIDDSELQFEYIRAAGPGGQNVNKVSSAVQLRFNLRTSLAIPDAVALRLEKLAGRRVTEDGVLVIEARRHRTQEQNRQDALDRLVELVRKALVEPKARRKTRPSAASKQRRLEAKRQRSITKRQRQKADFET